MKRILHIVISSAFTVVVIMGMNSVQAKGKNHSILNWSSAEKGSGTLTSQQREVGAFAKIESNIGADIFVTIGSPQKITITLDDNLMDYVDMEVHGRTLVIESNHSFSTRKQCKVEITVPKLEAIRSNGSGDVEVKNLDAERFDFEIEGSADVTAQGKVDRLSISVDGSGDVDVRELLADDVSVEINGSGDVSLTAQKNLDASINGSGDIIYYGNPDHVTKDISGSGRIRRKSI